MFITESLHKLQHCITQETLNNRLNSIINGLTIWTKTLNKRNLDNIKINSLRKMKDWTKLSATDTENPYKKRNKCNKNYHNKNLKLWIVIQILLLMKIKNNLSITSWKDNATPSAKDQSVEEGRTVWAAKKVVN